MNKQQKIVEMAKDICRVKHICNDVCKPISACDALRYAERAVEAGYSKQSGWISVDERLPERIGYYLTYTIRGTIEISRFYPFYVSDAPQFDYWITHWMPLPEAPKMKGGAE